MSGISCRGARSREICACFFVRVLRRGCSSTAPIATRMGPVGGMGADLHMAEDLKATGKGNLSRTCPRTAYAAFRRSDQRTNDP